MGRRYYTPELANRALPLVRSIVQEVVDVSRTASQVWREHAALPERSERRAELGAELLRFEQRLGGLAAELRELGVELKDPAIGLVDFFAQRHGREVCLCWKLGEPNVGFWHPLHGGFRSRRPIRTFDAADAGTADD
jgi:hypothetical protein